MGKTNQWESYIGHNLKIVFEDGGREVSIRKGLFSHVEDGILFIRTDFGIEGIPLIRVIRLEVKNEM
jgi:hypothetical protein